MYDCLISGSKVFWNQSHFANIFTSSGKSISAANKTQTIDNATNASENTNFISFIQNLSNKQFYIYYYNYTTLKKEWNI